MNRDEVLRMAVEAGISPPHAAHEFWICDPSNLKRFAALVADAARGDYHEGLEEGFKAGVVAEREECAKLCETKGIDLLCWWGDGLHGAATQECADAIRARGDS